MHRSPLLPTSGQRPKGAGLARRLAYATSAAAALVVVCMILMPSSRPTTLIQKTQSVLQRETIHVEHANKRLEQEDQELALMAKQAEAEVIAKKRQQALGKEKLREQALRRENAALELANQQMKQKMLATRAQLERAKIANMQAEIKSGVFPRVPGYHAQQLRAAHAVSPLMQLYKAQAQVSHAKGKVPLHMLAGQYVKACEDGRGCEFSAICSNPLLQTCV